MSYINRIYSNPKHSMNNTPINTDSYDSNNININV